MLYESNAPTMHERELLCVDLEVPDFNFGMAFNTLRILEYNLGTSVKGRSIVDVGCGSGRKYDNGLYGYRPPAFLLLLAARGARAYGIDPCKQNDGHTQYIREHGGDVLEDTIETVLTSKLNKGINPFGSLVDVVVTSYVIGRSPDPELVGDAGKSSWENIKRQRSNYFDVCDAILAPGGIALYDWDSWINRSHSDYDRYSVWQKPDESGRGLQGSLFIG